MQADDGRRWINGEAALGGLLVLLGIVVVLGQALDLDLGRVGWPFLVITPGLALLGLGLAAPGRLGEVLAMTGGVVAVNGLVLGVVRGRGDLAASGERQGAGRHPDADTGIGEGRCGRTRRTRSTARR